MVGTMGGGATVGTTLGTPMDTVRGTMVGTTIRAAVGTLLGALVDGAKECGTRSSIVETRGSGATAVVGLGPNIGASVSITLGPPMGGPPGTPGKVSGDLAKWRRLGDGEYLIAGFSHHFCKK
jgi:hypothetical protein